MIGIKNSCKDHADVPLFDRPFSLLNDEDICTFIELVLGDLQLTIRYIVEEALVQFAFELQLDASRVLVFLISIKNDRALVWLKRYF